MTDKSTISRIKRDLDLNWDHCSLGEPVGPGLRMGFEGWGEPHVFLDPASPPDFQVHLLGLEGAFSVVESKGLLCLLHGDCTLTHGVHALSSLAKPGGEILIEFVSLVEGMKMALSELEAGDYARAQVIEKTCFGQPMDKTGVLYPQTLISERKLNDLLAVAGLGNVKVEKRPSGELPPHLPDLFRLDGVEDKVWTESEEYFKMEESLSRDRPTCVLCDRVVTKRDHNRSFFSRYCKDHYHQARAMCDNALRESLSLRVRANKPGRRD